MQEGPEQLGLYARDAQVQPHLEQQNLGELITAEHKVLIETYESRNNHRYAIVGQHLAAERSVMKQNFLEPTGKPKVIYTDNSWNLALICEVDHGIIEKSKSTPRRSERFEIAE